MSMAVGVVLLIIASVTVILISRKGPGRLLPVALPFLSLAAVMYLMELPEERVHFLEYGVLGFLLIKAGGTRYRQLAFSLVIVIMASSLDEFIQLILPNRVGDMRDIAMNAAGGMIGLWVGRYWHLP
jgi:VanZ family protein